MLIDKSPKCIYIADMAKTITKTIRGVVFEWDEAKAAENPVSHDGVTFDEAVEVFF